jgi:hypothetical protein
MPSAVALAIDFMILRRLILISKALLVRLADCNSAARQGSLYDAIFRSSAYRMRADEAVIDRYLAGNRLFAA